MIYKFFISQFYCQSLRTLLEESPIFLSLFCHFILRSSLLNLSFKRVFRMSRTKVNMHMHYCLSSVLTILNCHVVLSVVNSLQLFGNFLGCHEKIQSLNLSEVLDFRNDPARTYQHMPLDKRSIINQAKNVFSHKKNLRTWNYGIVKNDIGD